jgi:hypothetical protein
MRELSPRRGGQSLTQVKRNALFATVNFPAIQPSQTAFSASPAQKRAFFEDNKQIGFNNFRPEKPPALCYSLCRFKQFLAGNIQPNRTVHFIF